MSEKNNSGLIQKYIVKKIDGSDIDPNALYFVLRYDNKQKDMRFGMACRQAMVTCSDFLEDHLPNLSKDILKAVNNVNNHDEEEIKPSVLVTMVDTINQYIYDKLSTNDEYSENGGCDDIGLYPIVEMVYATNHGYTIKFADFTIWSESNDERVWVDHETGKKEDLKTYIIKQVNKILSVYKAIGKI